ncbi:unnamed protein product [Menidia menidia]|uniref:(Atlantic silverside) hypothetical protein n=1 Tax=Menidia menidia TaxID=238744 RepID=A0A8S4AKP9_9TELE|nr:unnamed protein product [Menidia menidia]
MQRVFGQENADQGIAFFINSDSNMCMPQKISDCATGVHPILQDIWRCGSCYYELYTACKAQVRGQPSPEDVFNIFFVADVRTCYLLPNTKKENEADDSFRPIVLSVVLFVNLAQP